ncbi:ABC transporter ATP-binding protein [Thermophilibacter provencensis]|uniref:ATP-binding cassette domain-containing protein n=1 Tax=Thermophilibacter provencensis TaxID=1852386 RepID=A0ABT7V110_9ACTN|nr:ATP-binding cassette domain-containing protein [Thermophilibacter provencensis]MDM8270303.1 ATP-binding cassette domain-containing protein [Thermophilibacter provencensis]
MSALELDRVSFAYAGADAPVLREVSLVVPEGAFALFAGATGSGKSTLLRLAKPEISPAGALEGGVRVFGEDVRAFDPQASAHAVGYVFQNPDAQVVCDTVWHEMAFGLENLGVPEPEMRRRVAETCNFLGIEPWFRARTAELSGGQRQILALASALVMRPRLLLLDEPTSMLDPLAEKNFLALLFRANRELNITVVVATHTPETMADYATCAFELADGSVRPVDPPRAPEMLTKVPVTFVSTGGGGAGMRDVWLRYDRDARWVLRGLGLELSGGEVRALVGSNGCGKSTLLSVLAGVLRPQRGRVRNALAASQALLPQSPKALLAHETVRAELMEWSRAGGYGEAEVAAALERLGLADAAERHPHDLSGGQQQLLALEKLLLVRPRLLLLDEPTKGLDRSARERVARRVAEARSDGATVLLATHDLEFVRAVADNVSLMFDGAITVTEPTDEFFSNSWLYS